MSNEETDLKKYLAQEMNQHDHLTRKIYGPDVRFESLSAFGQHTIEELVRTSRFVDEKDPQIRELKLENLKLKYERDESQSKLASALAENEELWRENETIKMELYDAEDDRDGWRERFRQESSSRKATGERFSDI